MKRTLPYEGVKVLDFGQYIAGPAAAMMFADQGAEVIRIDFKEGNKWDNPATEIINRRKKSIALNLKNKEDLEIAKKLVMTADVLIENFRPGVMDRLGLGYDTTRKLNDRLIYVSIPGFAAKDEEYADVKAWEEIIGAASGMYTDMGLNRILMGINPSFTPVPMASAYGTTIAAMAAATALCAREKTGLGDYIEVPIAAALTEGLVYNGMEIGGIPRRYLSLREVEIERRQKEGLPLDLKYDELQPFLDPFFRFYDCKDGRKIYMVACCQVNHCHRILKVLGLYEEAIAAGLPELDDWYCSSSEWPEGVDCALGMYPLSKKWADYLSVRMQKKFMEKTSKEWEDIFGVEGVALSRTLTTAEWLHTEHPLASGLILEIDHPKYGKFRGMGPAAWTNSSADYAATPALAPTTDQHREEILKSIKDAKPVQSGKEHPGTPWLKDLKIVDLTNVIAGPETSGTLVRFAPNVIKVDGVKPTYDAWNTVCFGMFASQSKRSMLLDLKTVEGRKVMKKLIAWADVVVFNGIQRQMKELEIDWDTIHAINPKAVFTCLSGWGGPKVGPKSEHFGYDDIVQSSTGIMARFGGSYLTPEEQAHIGVIDVLGGHCAAFATMVALYQRYKTGEGDVANTSLCATGQLLQIPFMYDYDGRNAFNEPSGRESKGYNSIRRFYKASNGWFYLGAMPEDINALEKIEGFKGIKAMSEDERTEFLSKMFEKDTRENWKEKLKTVDVASMPLGYIKDLREKHSYDFDGTAYHEGDTYQWIAYNDHPIGNRVVIGALDAVRPKYAATVAPTPLEKQGSSTIEILKEQGYSEEEIKKLLEIKAVSTSWGKQYLPD